MVCKNIIDKTKLNMQNLLSTKKLAITNLSTIHWKKKGHTEYFKNTLL